MASGFLAKSTDISDGERPNSVFVDCVGRALAHPRNGVIPKYNQNETGMILQNRSSPAIYCTFTALLRKPLKISGAGEGNRTRTPFYQ